MEDMVVSHLNEDIINKTSSSVIWRIWKRTKEDKRKKKISASAWRRAVIILLSQQIVKR